MTVNPAKAMKLLNEGWKHKDHICKVPLTEGSEKFANAGVGNAPRGLQAPTTGRTMEFVMEEGIKMGHTAFQLCFGNKEWEPSVALAKDAFKKVHRKHNTELSFVQQVGDHVCCENTFQGDKKSVHLSNEEIAMWIRDWQIRKRKIRQMRHASTEQQECVGTCVLPRFPVR